MSDISGLFRDPLIKRREAVLVAFRRLVQDIQAFCALYRSNGRLRSCVVPAELEFHLIALLVFVDELRPEIRMGNGNQPAGTFP
jgi:hypothetical protein